jgi:hypothetical protein
LRILSRDLKYKREARVRTQVANMNRLHRMHRKRKTTKIMIDLVAHYLKEKDNINDEYTYLYPFLH